MKKILSLSALALILTVLLAGGSTHSWFIDSVALTDNIFTAEIPIQTKRLYDLNIGDRVADITWNWEFKTGDGYTGSGEEKPVVWIVVAKDHHAYQNHAGHGVLLLSEEIIAKNVYDNGQNSLWQGCIANVWLNSIFYNAFPGDFKDEVLTTTVPNKRRDGSNYNTVDKVFLLSGGELGAASYMVVGNALGYFGGNEADARRKALLGGVPVPYWTRTPKGTNPPQNVFYVNADGVTYRDQPPRETGTHVAANTPGYGYRPALNMDGNTLVNSEPENGVHVIHWP